MTGNTLSTLNTLDALNTLRTSRALGTSSTLRASRASRAGSTSGTSRTSRSRTRRKHKGQGGRVERDVARETEVVIFRLAAIALEGIDQRAEDHVAGAIEVLTADPGTRRGVIETIFRGIGLVFDEHTGLSGLDPVYDLFA